LAPPASSDSTHLPLQKTEALQSTTVVLGDTLVFLNFYLPTTLAADGIMLTATDEADSTGSKINVGIDGPNGGMRFHEILTIGS